MRGLPSYVEAKTGKRANIKDYMSVATGQARLFGQETEGAAAQSGSRRQGKRQFQVPTADQFNILQ